MRHQSVLAAAVRGMTAATAATRCRLTIRPADANEVAGAYAIALENPTTCATS